MTSLYDPIRNPTRQAPGANVAKWQVRRVWRDRASEMWYEATPDVLAWLLSYPGCAIEATCVDPDRLEYA